MSVLDFVANIGHKLFSDKEDPASAIKHPDKIFVGQKIRIPRAS